MNRNYRTWRNKLIRRIMRERGVSLEYADAVSIGKRNYYPIPVEQVSIH